MNVPSRAASRPDVSTTRIMQNCLSTFRTNTGRLPFFSFLLVLISFAFPQPEPLQAEAMPVRYPEGLLHGFLVLRTLEGTEIADGDLIQVSHRDRVTADLVFHFKDGSLHRETVIFSQRRKFHLLSGHLVQKGPSFPHPLDLSIDGSTGNVKVKYTDDDGKEREADDHMSLPDDVSNGMVTTLLKNMGADQQQMQASMIVAAPKPQLIKLLITNEGEEPFSLGASERKATHYKVKVELGGLTGVLAPLLGKQPPDTHVWILGGESPTFVKSEGPFFYGGPIWRIELIAPTWPSKSSATGDKNDRNATSK